MGNSFGLHYGFAIEAGGCSGFRPVRTCNILVGEFWLYTGLETRTPTINLSQDITRNQHKGSRTLSPSLPRLLFSKSFQWPFQDPKLEVPTIYKAAYVMEYPLKIWPYMVLYRQFRILELPLKLLVGQGIKSGNLPALLAVAPRPNGLPVVSPFCKACQK
jgi:hypothetical protein